MTVGLWCVFYVGFMFCLVAWLAECVVLRFCCLSFLGWGGGCVLFGLFVLLWVMMLLLVVAWLCVGCFAV